MANPPTTSANYVSHKSICVISHHDLYFFKENRATDRFLVINDTVPMIIHFVRNTHDESCAMKLEVTTKSGMHKLVKKMLAILDNPEYNMLQIVPNTFIGKCDDGTIVQLMGNVGKKYNLSLLRDKIDEFANLHLACIRWMGNDTYHYPL